MKLNQKMSRFFLVIVVLMLNSCGGRHEFIVRQHVYPPTNEKTIEQVKEFYLANYSFWSGQTEAVVDTFSFRGTDKKTHYVFVEFIPQIEPRIIIGIFEKPHLLFPRPRPCDPCPTCRPPIPPCFPLAIRDYVETVQRFYGPEFETIGKHSLKPDPTKIAASHVTSYKQQPYLIEQEVILNYEDGGITVKLDIAPYHQRASQKQ